MNEIARNNSIFMQFLTKPVETANERWIENCDIDMRQFALLASPFLYISCVITIATISSIISYSIGRRLKEQSSHKRQVDRLSVKSKLLQSTDRNGNTQLSPDGRVILSSSNNLPITSPSTTDARNNVTSRDISCPNFSSSTNSTFIMSPSSTDLKPFLLILNGFFFGIFGVGIPIVYVCTQSGYDMFSCDATPDVDDVKTKAVKHLGMVYLIIMLSDFLHPLCCLLRLPYIDRRDISATALTKHYWSVNMQLVHVSIWTILQLLEIIVYPGGFSIFTGFMIMIHRTYLYGYLAMTIASHQVSPTSLRTKWRSGLLWIQLVSNLAICFHHTYFSLFTSKSCGSKSVLNSTAIYCAITSLVMAGNLLANRSESKRKSS